MIKLLVVLLVALLFEATGVVLLKAGLNEIGEAKGWNRAEIIRLLTRGITNKHILAGVLFEACFFGALVYLLARSDVSLLWPLTSLSFVITALFAKFYLNETVPVLRWWGVVLIVMGAFLISWSEKPKEGKTLDKSSPSLQVQ